MLVLYVRHVVVVHRRAGQRGSHLWAAGSSGWISPNYRLHRLHTEHGIVFSYRQKSPLVSHAWCDTTPPRQPPSAEINTSVATNSTVPRTPPGRCSGDAKSKGTRQQRAERSRKMHREMNAMHTMCRTGLHQGITASPSPSHPHLLIHSSPHFLILSPPLARSPPHPLTPSTPHPLTCSPPHPLIQSPPQLRLHCLTSSSSYRLH